MTLLLFQPVQRSQHLVDLIGFGVTAILLQANAWITRPRHFEDVVTAAYTGFPKALHADRQYVPKASIRPGPFERRYRLVEGHDCPPFRQGRSRGALECQSLATPRARNEQAECRV